jgi:hypothetical protein
MMLVVTMGLQMVESLVSKMDLLMEIYLVESWVEQKVANWVDKLVLPMVECWVER